MSIRKRTAVRPFFIIGLILLLIILVLLTMNNFFVRQLTYPAPSVTVPQNPPEPLENVTLTIYGQTSVSAWKYIAHDDGPFVLFFHGNGENLATMWQSGTFENLKNLEVNFLAIDYPGYGRSEGEPSEESILETAKAAVSWIIQNYPNQQLIVCGWSLGAAVAIQTAEMFPADVDALIALSAWSSLRDVASEHYPDWLVRLVLKEKYNSCQTAERIHVPVLLIHGVQDQIIPIEQGKSLIGQFPVKPRWIEIPDANHNTLLAYPEVWREIKMFIGRVAESTE